MSTETEGTVTAGSTEASSAETGVAVGMSTGGANAARDATSTGAVGIEGESNVAGGAQEIRTMSRHSKQNTERMNADCTRTFFSPKIECGGFSHSSPSRIQSG